MGNQVCQICGKRVSTSEVILLVRGNLSGVNIFNGNEIIGLMHEDCLGLITDAKKLHIQL